MCDPITIWLKTLPRLLIAFRIKFKFQVVVAPPQTVVVQLCVEVKGTDLRVSLLAFKHCCVTCELDDLSLWATVLFSKAGNFFIEVS